MKPILKISFFAVMLLYLWFPYQMISSQESLLEEGLLYKFKSIPVDPYDAFRGSYVALNLDLNGVKNKQLTEEVNTNDLVYAQVENDAEGYAYLSNVFTEKPDFENYVKARVSYLQQDEVFLMLPDNLSRYYMNEKLAPLAEKYYRQLNSIQNGNREEVNAHLNVRLKNGNAIIEELYFKNLPVKDYLNSVVEE